MTSIDNVDQLEAFRLSKLPPSAFYVPNFVDEAEEQMLLSKIYAAPIPKWKTVSDRRVQNWGKRCLVKVNDIPDWLQRFMERISGIAGLYPNNMRPNHVLINEYLPGQGIMPHTDGPAYYPVVANVSLLSDTVMDFYAQDGDKRLHVGSILLQARSLLIVQEALYGDHLHGIACRSLDPLDDRVVNLSLCSPAVGCTMERCRRLSLTIRCVPRVITTTIGCRIDIVSAMVLVRGADPAALIRENPYDVSAWDVFIHSMKEMPEDAAQLHFEDLVKTFPLCGYYWKVYIEYEVAKENYAKLFERCLTKVLNIDLWKSYVQYTMSQLAKKGEYRKVLEMFDFTLDKVGMDHQIYAVYKLYIDFLQSSSSQCGLSSSEVRIESRKLYHRALNTPMANYKQLWRDYCCFEQKADTRKASERIGNMMSIYTHVQKVSQEMDSLVWNLNRKHVSVPCTNSVTESEQLNWWREYIYWEKSNPLQTSDYCLYVRRVMYAFEQALLCFMYHLECWCEPIDFLQNAAETAYQMKLEEVSDQYCVQIRTLFDRAINSSMSKTLLLYSMYADFEEGQCQWDKVHSIYKSFIKIPDIDPNLAYIQYMQFLCRTEGINAVRTVFKAARMDRRVKSEVYTVAAYLEFFANRNDKVATRIFQVALKKFPNNGDFALTYVNFLLRLNDDASLRVLFERILTSGNLQLEEAAALWDRYLEFEARVGGLAGIVSVSERRQTALGKQFGEIPTALLIDRYRFMDLMPAADSDLRMLGYTEVLSISRAHEVNADEISKASVECPKPNLAGLLPFKPRKTCKNFCHPVPGGDFPPPLSVARIMSFVPPPTCYSGPFVKIDDLLEIIRGISGLGSSSTITDKLEISRDKADGTKKSVDTRTDVGHLLQNLNSEFDDDQIRVFHPPPNDIFRKRYYGKK